MKILQINTALNRGSVGRIAEQIGEFVLRNGGESYIAFSRPGLPSRSKTIKIGNILDVYLHGLCTRLFDKHGFASKKATINLIKDINNIKPDIIHLHNIHGYYININLLFNYLNKTQTPIVWTFHDAWPFTGHCTYFDSVSCEKWKTECFSCPKNKMYPKSWFIDNSKQNFKKKKELFTKPKTVKIVTPSNWLRQNVKLSFLKKYPVEVIHNGIDLSIFKPDKHDELQNKYNLINKKIILGVASLWDKRKGLDDFIVLSKKLNHNYKIVLIGLNKKQGKHLPKNILYIERTENVHELAAWYSSAFIFINPTYQDNFPTTNIEALACGTPVITYKTGGSPEAIDKNTGIIVEKGDIEGVKNAIDYINNDKVRYSEKMCRERAVQNFNRNDRFRDYYKIYSDLSDNITLERI